MNEIADYKPPSESVQKVQALFLGQIGAGKSSFYNSVDSVFQGYVINQAPAGAESRSVTKKVSFMLENLLSGITLDSILIGARFRKTLVTRVWSNRNTASGIYADIKYCIQRQKIIYICCYKLTRIYCIHDIECGCKFSFSSKTLY